MVFCHIERSRNVVIELTDFDSAQSDIGMTKFTPKPLAEVIQFLLEGLSVVP